MHSVYMSYQIFSLVLYFVQDWGYIYFHRNLCLFYNLSKCILLLFLICSISAAVIPLPSFALMVQSSLLYNKAGRLVYCIILLLFVILEMSVA